MTRFIGLVLALTALTGCGHPSYSGAPIPLAPAHGLATQSGLLRATLSTQQSDVLLGQYLLLTVRFENQGPARTFYNPTFDPNIPAPAVLAIYDYKNRYIGNLLPQWQTAIPKPEAWVTVPTGGVVEGTISVQTDVFPGRPALRLKPGGYKVQLIYTQAFLMPRPASGEVDGSALYQQLGQVDLMRSNALPVHLSPLLTR